MAYQSSKVQGSITVQGDKAFVQFRYSQQRFNAIKKVRGAVFDREQKRWVIPLGNLPAITSLPEFAPGAVRYDFDTTAVAREIEIRNTSLEAALKRVQANPFSVLRTDIEITQPDIVFTLSQHGTLRATLGHKSRAKRYLENVCGAHYIRKEQSYFFPADLLNDFLILLRDKRVRFAVDETASERLKRGSLLRSHLTERPGAGTSAELFEALLVPILDADPDDRASLRLIGWTTEQLRECFPDVRAFSEKKMRAASMSPLQAAELLSNAAARSLSIWRSKSAQNLLERFEQSNSNAFLSDGFDDNLLALSTPEICWTIQADGCGGLLLTKALYTANFEPQSRAKLSCTPRPEPRSAEHVFLGFRDSQLLRHVDECCRLVNAKRIPRSRNFLKLVAELEQRQKLLLRRQQFQALRDHELSLSNATLTQQLFPHQRVAVQWLLETEHGILADDMGLGKTLSVLAGVQELQARRAISKILIICPNSLVRNWLREAAQWTGDRRLFALPADKGERQRFLKRLHANPQFDGLVVNYETARLDYVYPLLKELFTREPSFLCIDESQRIKNPHSKAFQVINELASVFSRRILLTGTPTPKDLSDIWGQMMIVDRGQRFGTRFYEWLPKVAELGNKYSDVAVRRFIPEQVEETIVRVQEVMLRRRKEEVVNLPEKLFTTRDIELNGDQLRRYQEICDELLIRVTALTGDDYIRTIDSLLEQYLRAVQVASNPRLIDPHWAGEPAKFIELDSIVSEVVQGQSGKIVIWTNYLGNVDELVDRYGELGSAAFSGQVSTSERNRIVEAFQDMNSALKVLVAVPGAGGVGITLTASQTAVYVDKTWNAEHWMQSVNRIHRIGQCGTVNIISLHASKVDDLIAFSVRRKEKMQEKVLRGIHPQQDELRPSLDELRQALRQEPPMIETPASTMNDRSAAQN